MTFVIALTAAPGGRGGGPDDLVDRPHGRAPAVRELVEVLHGSAGRTRDRGPDQARRLQLPHVVGHGGQARGAAVRGLARAGLPDLLQAFEDPHASRVCECLRNRLGPCLKVGVKLGAAPSPARLGAHPPNMVILNEKELNRCALMGRQERTRRTAATPTPKATTTPRSRPGLRRLASPAPARPPARLATAITAAAAQATGPNSAK